MQSRRVKTNGKNRPVSRSSRSGIRWELYDEGHHIAYVRGNEGAYQITAMEHPRFLDGKGWAVVVDRARDNTSGSMDEERVADYKGSVSDMGRDPETFIKERAEALYLQQDVFLGNITEGEYRSWNALHSGREGYRASDRVIYARPKGSKSVFMPFTPYGHTTRRDDTLHAMRVGPEYEESVRRFLDKNVEDSRWEFEARSGPEGPNERRMRPDAPAVSKSTRPGSAKERLAWDLVELAYDLDPYEFKDQYGSKDELYEGNLSMLSSKKGISELIAYYDGESIDFDSGLEARRKDALKRLRGLNVSLKSSASKRKKTVRG